MDRPAPNPTLQQDIVYCHQCDNEWYRSAHGMTPCPECGGEFTEVIEEGHDPREEPDAPQTDDAPDPDEEDIEHFEWRNNGPDQPPGAHFHGTINRTIRINARDLQQSGGEIGGLGGVLSGLIGPAIQNALRQRLQQAQPEPAEEGGGTYTHTHNAPGVSYTVTTSTRGNMQPRNANAPQGFQPQPEGLDRMLATMMQNIGARPNGAGAFGFGPPHGIFAGNGNDMPIGGGGGMPGGPVSNLFRFLGLPGGGMHGDAVYSQEALDRVVSQLMEQHTSGNAPGPASQQAIDSLSKRQISQQDLDEQGKADCTICMDDAEIGATVTVLPCDHWFHFDCIKLWLAEHDTCPHCRKGIMPEGAQTDQARQPNQPPLNNMNIPTASSNSGYGSMPGGFPSQAQASGQTGGTRGDGSQAHPLEVPNSPQGTRQQGGSGSMFGRMRDTFGGDRAEGGAEDGGQRRS